MAELTDIQKAALQADMFARTELATFIAVGDDIAVANFYNTIAAPDFYVWKTYVPLDEIMQNGFDWTQVDNLTVGKARIWEWLFSNNSQAINPAKSNIRAGIDECWKGTAAMLAVQAAVYVHCKRTASLIEKMFSAGTGTLAVPATMGFEGPVSWQDVSGARVWQ